MLWKVAWRGKVLEIELPIENNVEALKQAIESISSVPVKNQKLICRGKVLSADLPLASVENAKLILVGSEEHVIHETSKNELKTQLKAKKSPFAVNLYDQPSSRGKFHLLSDPSRKFTFAAIKALEFYPEGVERARSILTRLANDPAIVHIMQLHSFSVGLLTEMDPAMNTDANSKKLGLNQNAGQVIELRLRTDRYDGFRHYNGIRTVLLHELTHNVHRDHDSKFWKLFHELERELKQFEQSRMSGHKLGGDDVEYYRPEEAEEIRHQVDEGSVVGGSYVLNKSHRSQSAQSEAERKAAVAEATSKRANMQKEQK